MTLEEKIRALSAKGEMVHLSLAAHDGGYRCVYAAASTSAGYSSFVSRDPVAAILGALASAPVKIRAPRARPDKETDEPVTAAVSDEPKHSLPTDWTKP